MEDVQTFTIPDGYSAAAGLITVLISGKTELRFAVVVMAAWLMTAILFCAAGKDVPIGMGDAKLIALLSVGMGWRCAAAFAYASVLSGVFCAAGLLLRRLKRRDNIPFAPFICLSSFFVIAGMACNQSLI